MRATAVIEAQVSTDPSPGFGNAGMGPQVDFFVFNGWPKRSTKTLSRDVPSRPRLILRPRAGNTLMKSYDVNWLLWSVLKISGLPYRSKASLTSSM